MAMGSPLPMVSLVLSVIGAVLNLVSGTSILAMASVPIAGNMGMMPPGSGITMWALLLYGLGGLLIVTGVLGVTHVGMSRMRTFGGIMVVYGVVMLIIGGSMFMGITPVMQGAISSMGMLLVGLAMIVNGTLMATRPKMREAGT